MNAGNKYPPNVDLVVRLQCEPHVDSSGIFCNVLSACVTVTSLNIVATRYVFVRILLHNAKSTEHIFGSRL